MHALALTNKEWAHTAWDYLNESSEAEYKTALEALVAMGSEAVERDNATLECRLTGDVDVSEWWKKHLHSFGR